MATKKKLIKDKWAGDPVAIAIEKSQRSGLDWRYAYPDDRNRLIEEAREIINYAWNKNKKNGTCRATEAEHKAAEKAARRWLKETKP